MAQVLIHNPKKTIVLLLTPAELRGLADKIEKQLARPVHELWGESTVVHTLVGDDVEIDFAFEPNLSKE